MVLHLYEYFCCLQTVTLTLKDDHMWCMDDLFPIFQFVVVRSKIRHLGAEIHMMDDLIEPHLEHGEFGLMFTTLKVCFHHLYSLFDELYYMIIKPGFCNVPLTPTLHIISSFFSMFCITFSPIDKL